MIMGYGIIVVPTGIVTVEVGCEYVGRTCLQCGRGGHDADTDFWQVG